MSLQMLFYSIIVRFDRVHGYQYLARMHEQRFGPNIWYDRDIIRDGGAMSYDDVQTILEAYDSMRLSITSEQTGVSRWENLCVVGSRVGVLERECDWVHYDAENNTASLVGGDEFVVLTDQKLHRVNRTPGTRIVGSVRTGNVPEAGAVQFDDFSFGYNYDKNGVFELFLPNPLITELRSQRSRHAVTVHDFHTGIGTRHSFQLADTDQIDLGMLEA